MGESTTVTLAENTPAIQPDAPVTPPTPQNTDRPQWLPEKFKSPEDLAKAYGELESKLGKPQTPTPPADPKGIEIKPEAPKDNPAQPLIQQATQEFVEKGELAPETYAALEKQGLTKDLVDGYIEGQRAKMARAESELLEPFGGRQQFDAMAGWAAQNLEADVVSALNEQFAKGGAAAKAGLMSLQALYKAQNPTLIDGEPGYAPVQGYRSIDEMVRDMQNPLYDQDQAFRDQVEAKLRRSNL